MLVHLSLFVKRQTQTVYRAELRCQARVLVHLSLFVLFQRAETSDTCVSTPSLFVLFRGVEMSGTFIGTTQSVCVVSGS